VDRDVDFGAVPGQRFVDRVVHHLEHQVVQAGAVGGVADVHARAFAHRFQPFQNLNLCGAVLFDLCGDDWWCVLGHGLLSQKTILNLFRCAAWKPGSDPQKGQTASISWPISRPSFPRRREPNFALDATKLDPSREDDGVEVSGVFRSASA
jgi:hypothetical protein